MDEVKKGDSVSESYTAVKALLCFIKRIT